MLMLIGTLPPVDETDVHEVSQVVAIRFFESADGVERVLRLARKQARKRHPQVDKKTIEWNVYEPRVATAGRGPHTGGHPEWQGEVSYFI